MRTLSWSTFLWSLAIALSIYRSFHASFSLRFDDDPSLVGIEAPPPSARGNSTSVPLTSPNTTLRTTNPSLQCVDPVQLCRRFASNIYDHAQSDNSTRRTLALGDPALRGGFRNQYIRFTSLVAHAWRYQYPELLLPSIKWLSMGSMLLNKLRVEQDNATIVRSTVPFQFLYDVDHWNSFHQLPKLVDFSPQHHSQWNPTTTIFFQLCPMTEQWFNRPPKTDLTGFIKPLSHPYGAGGGGGIGVLWEDYRRRYDSSGKITLENGTIVQTQYLERLMADALRPSVHMQTILDEITLTINQTYLAFHARFEPEMLVHFMCEESKERDLAKVVGWIQQEPDFSTMDSMFIAISMADMKETYRFNDHQILHKTNVETLEQLLAKGITTDKKKVWMAGEDAVKLHVNPCMLQLVSSFINLELAVNAKFFLGTSTSTWSVGVWKLRYFRGLPNYEYTSEGIRKIEGPPKPFSC